MRIELTLDAAQKRHAITKYIREQLESARETGRNHLERSKSHDETQHLRGQIAIIRQLLTQLDEETP